MATEIELKLRLPPEHDTLLLAQLAQMAAEFNTCVAAPVQLTSTYYDTPDFQLRARSISLRLRNMGGRWLQTVKGKGFMLGGLAQRDEDEVALPDAQLNLMLIQDDAIRQWLQDELADQLQALFVTQFSRRLLQLPLPSGGQIELVYDQGTVFTEQESVVLSEVELELHDGRLDELYDIAQALLTQVPLRVETQSKAARGYQLCGYVGAAPAAVTYTTEFAQLSVEALVNHVSAWLSRWQFFHTQLLQQPLPQHSAEVLQAVEQTTLWLNRLLLRTNPLEPSNVLAELHWLQQAMVEADDAVRRVALLRAPRYQQLLLQVGRVLNDQCS